MFNATKTRSKRTLSKDIQSSNALLQGIADFLEVSINKNSLQAVYTFLFIEIMLFVIVFGALLSDSFSMFSALFWSLLLPFSVLVFLRFKIHANRVAISFEGLEMINELVNNYKIYHHNLQEAIDQTIYSLDEEKSPLSIRMLLNLSYRIRDAHSTQDIQRAVDQMDLTMDVSWSKQLANLFKIGITKGEDITQGLMDIAIDLGELERMYEKKRQLNIEGNFMLKGLIPLIILAGMYFIFGVADFNLYKFMDYQFGHPVGMRMFLVMILCIIGSFFIHMFFSRSKNDF